MFRLLAVSLAVYFSSVINGAHTRTSSTDPSTAFKQSEELLRQTAIGLVKGAGILLLDTEADPYTDTELAQLITSAFYMYHATYDRPLPDLTRLDFRTRMAFKLAILGEILQVLGASKESTRAFELLLSSGKGLSDISLNDFTPGLYNHTPLDKWASAVMLVRAVRFLIDQDNGDPYTDEKLARLVNEAIYEYNYAYSRPGHTFKPNEGFMTEAKIEELEDIFKLVDIHDRREMKRAPQQFLEDNEEKVNSTGVIRAPKVDAEYFVTEVVEALDDPDADPFEDKELAQRIDNAIEKYRKAYSRRKLRLQGLDEQSQMELKVKEIYSIFEEMGKRNAGLLKILDKLTI